MRGSYTAYVQELLAGCEGPSLEPKCKASRVWVFRYLTKPSCGRRRALGPLFGRTAFSLKQHEPGRGICEELRNVKGVRVLLFTRTRDSGGWAWHHIYHNPNPSAVGIQPTPASLHLCTSTPLAISISPIQRDFVYEVTYDDTLILAPALCSVLRRGHRCPSAQSPPGSSSR